MNAKIIYYFVFDGLVDYEASYALVAINNPQFQREPNGYKVVVVSETTIPIITAGGVHITPDVTLSEIDTKQAAMLILPGGAKWEKGGNMEVIDTAKKILKDGGVVAAICGATLGLAKAGLLDKRQHTSNAPEYLSSSGYRGASNYVDTDAITDSGIITAGGVFPTGFAREIAEALQLYEADVADAWYHLIKTGDKKYFFELVQHAQHTH